MTAEELASRLGVTDSTVIRLESSETRRSVQLDTLMRAASALDCELVYALVPHHTLDEAFHAQAERQAERQVLDVAHTMALEDQTPATAEQQAMIGELTDDLVRSGRVRWRA
jgi:predicted DNA-binding mobile mystery protein A